MKKIVTILTSVLLLIICIFSLTACSKVPADYKDARTNLRNNGYYVSVGTNSYEATSIVYDVLDAAISYLESFEDLKKGVNLFYSFEEDVNDLLKDIDSCVFGISESGSGKDCLLIIYFDDAKALSEHYDIFANIFDLIIGSSWDGYDELLINNSDLSYGKSKNILFIGTKQAFKDSKK